jgi:O-antigen biosynthesis protein
MIPTANAGVNYYRMAAWAFQMRKYRNVEAALFAFQYDMNELHPWQKDIVSNPHVRQSIDDLCEKADVVIWQPVHHEHTLDFYLEMRHRHDKPMLVEVDDNYIDVPEWSEAFHSFMAMSHYRKTSIQHLRNADALIVTTPHLKQTYSQFNDHIEIMPNSLDFKGDRKFVGWDTVSVRKHEGIRIGWIGGRAHFNDLMAVAEPLREVLSRNSEVKLVLVNSALKQSCQLSGRPFPFEGLNVLVADRSVPINRYATFMASFGFDIGIAPLEDCNFNRSKSNLRWLEYSALKIPCVASGIGNFAETVRPGKDGLLVNNNNPDEWVTYLQGLVDSADFRARLGRDANARVKKDFNIKNNAAKYVRTLKKIVNQAIPADLEDVCNIQNFSPLSVI